MNSITNEPIACMRLIFKFYLNYFFSFISLYKNNPGHGIKELALHKKLIVIRILEMYSLFFINFSSFINQKYKETVNSIPSIEFERVRVAQIIEMGIVYRIKIHNLYELLGNKNLHNLII